MAPLSSGQQADSLPAPACPPACPPPHHHHHRHTQERATKVSHGGTARIAKACGDEPLAKMAGLIAADESRHEAAYTRTMDAIFKA